MFFVRYIKVMIGYLTSYIKKSPVHLPRLSLTRPLKRFTGLLL
jgi:hypothetical protein